MTGRVQRILLISAAVCLGDSCASFANHVGYHVRSAANIDNAATASLVKDPPLKTRRQLRQDELLSRSITRYPTKSPSPTQSRSPSTSPTSQHSSLPSVVPSSRPTDVPSLIPSLTPTFQPSTSPSFSPTLFPSSLPSSLPSGEPSSRPTVRPSFTPSLSAQPSKSTTSSPIPSISPTMSQFPSMVPTETLVPTGAARRTSAFKVETQTAFRITIHTNTTNSTTAIDKNELENKTETIVLDQIPSSELSDSKIIQIDLVLLSLPKEKDVKREEFILSGYLICIRGTCPSTNELDAFILQSLSNNTDKLLMSIQEANDPMLQSVVDIDISIFNPSENEIVESNRLDEVADDAGGSNTPTYIPLLTSAALCFAFVTTLVLRYCKNRPSNEVDFGSPTGEDDFDVMSKSSSNCDTLRAMTFETAVTEETGYSKRSANSAKTIVIDIIDGVGRTEKSCIVLDSF